MYLNNPSLPKDGLIYLASPYSSTHRVVVQQRQMWAEWTTVKIVESGRVVFSPIAHCHNLAERYGLPGDINYWQKYDSLFIEKCDMLWVLMLPGYAQSRGLRHDIELAYDLNKPVYSVTMDLQAYEPTPRVDGPWERSQMMFRLD